MLGRFCEQVFRLVIKFMKLKVKLLVMSGYMARVQAMLRLTKSHLSCKLWLIRLLVAKMPL